ncbi:histidinol-phosphatase [Aureibacter tunicatorum]|uniref:Histidinol-phosphatase n=1 Tax=Aureibacter tunicatorum TaxID=866807 RepID=A0AAE3XPJ5_9BACT|nr:histidinol-phosphatase [Aureibacter tunicatorum]MDR6241701.1 histidinol-phosphatase (PHP family) [Aureibacter tunicatorum]BDD07314.1 histidinol-phosphatase [Aureibacter tunicatorum]
MKWANFHSHTKYCDGKGEIQEIAEEAIKAGCISYGFSSHVPVPFDSVWNMKMSDLKNYLAEIDNAKEQYSSDIQLYKSLEVDFIPNLIGPESQWIKDLNLDYTIGSVHYVDAFKDGMPWEIDGTYKLFYKGFDEIFNKDIKSAVKRYFELTRMMLEDSRPDVLGHMDKIRMHCKSGETFFDEQEGWYVDEIDKTLNLVKQKNVIVEINTRSIYKKVADEPYPSVETIKLARDKKIDFCLNSDSHHYSEITKEFSFTASLLLSLGIKTIKVFVNGEWKDFYFNEQGLLV